MGHAEGYVRYRATWPTQSEELAAWDDLQEEIFPHIRAIVRFNKAIVRWPERMTRAVKMRAGAKVGLPVEVTV